MIMIILVVKVEIEDQNLEKMKVVIHDDLDENHLVNDEVDNKN
jgi:hypothetical protein